MPAARLWRRIVRHGERKREEAELESKKWIMELMSHARCVTYALEANQELPPTKEEHNKKKPDWGKIHKAREERLEFMKRHHMGISHPYFFEEYMGFASPERGHLFDPPTDEVLRQADPKSRIEQQREEARARESRILEKLKAIAARGDGDQAFGSFSQG